MIDNDTMLTTKHLLAEMASNDYGFEEKGVELQTRVTALRHQLASLSGVERCSAARRGLRRPPVPDMVRLQEDYLNPSCPKPGHRLEGALADSIDQPGGRRAVPTGC